MSELRGLVRGLAQRTAVPPDLGQLEKLFDMVQRSQQGYRDLIDSFDDVLLALTLDGEVRAVNRSFADLVGMRFQQIVGRHISEFMEEANGEARTLIDRAMPRFIDRRHWTGVRQTGRFRNRFSVPRNLVSCPPSARAKDSGISSSARAKRLRSVERLSANRSAPPAATSAASVSDISCALM